MEDVFVPKHFREWEKTYVKEGMSIHFAAREMFFAVGEDLEDFYKYFQQKMEVLNGKVSNEGSVLQVDGKRSSEQSAGCGEGDEQYSSYRIKIKGTQLVAKISFERE